MSFLNNKDAINNSIMPLPYNDVSVSMQKLLAATMLRDAYTYTGIPIQSLQSRTVTHIPIGAGAASSTRVTPAHGNSTMTMIAYPGNFGWEDLCVMPTDNQEPARRARETEVKIAQGIAQAKGGLVCNAITALHGQHSYNGRPNQFVPE